MTEFCSPALSQGARYLKEVSSGICDLLVLLLLLLSLLLTINPVSHPFPAWLH